MTEKAKKLSDAAVKNGQAAHTIRSDDDIPQMRSHIREMARAQGIRIRTGIIDGHILGVALADAKVWTDTTAVMREKFTP